MAGSNVDAPTTRWLMRDAGDASDDGWEELRREFDLHPVVARILARRGIRSAEQAEGFLQPRLADMHDPFSMKNMDVAVETVLEALEAEARIVVHGDYDVDGMSGTSLLVEFLRYLGGNVDFVIPHRVDDGYGLGLEKVQRLAEDGYDLMITVDCGVTAHEPIAAAREAGMDVVVLDHHQPDGQLPPANAILNPVREDCDFPFEGLAAVGVAFNFAVAIRATMRRRGLFEAGREPDLKGLLDLVALGTVADVVPLEDENRAFVRHGLNRISDRTRPGLAALAEEACSGTARITANTVGYKLAPRLNAAGRIDDATQCVELLTTADIRRARAIARRLESLNDERRAIQDEVLEAALETARRQVEESLRVLVVDGPNWHRGVLGIVAGRLSERFHRPAIVLSREDGLAQGSARSIDGVDMVALLGQADDLLKRYGGHAAAAGMKLAVEDVEEFRERLQEALDDMLEGDTLPKPVVEVDDTVEVGELDRRFLRDLRRLQPFGHGNPEPTLVCRGVRSRKTRIVGSDHLKAEFDDGSGCMGGIGFSMGNYREMLDERVCVAFTPQWNVFRGRGKLEMHLQDLRPDDGDDPIEVEERSEDET